MRIYDEFVYCMSVSMHDTNTKCRLKQLYTSCDNSHLIYSIIFVYWHWKILYLQTSVGLQLSNLEKDQ